MAWNTERKLKELADQLRAYDGRPLRIMEVCGTHTHENYRNGIRSLLPKSLRLVAGPGCPVCVTPAGFVDMALELASRSGVMICSFGDLIRVPGGAGESLARARAKGADIHTVYSPLDAVDAARENPLKQIVFLSVGFETTAPASCLAVKKAAREELQNFSLLCACKTMTNAYYSLAGSADAFLYPGHVSAITGMGVYKQLSADGISGVVAGFGAGELLVALSVIIEKIRQGGPFAVNCYPRVVTDEGNPLALKLLDEVMVPCNALWRGLGEVKDSGLRLRDEFAFYDAEKRYELVNKEPTEDTGCRCGEVLRGDIEPPQCPHYGGRCTPDRPVGACMVSSEGACAAFYKYGVER